MVYKMNRTLIARIHAFFGTLSLLIILSFFTSTVIVELQGDIIKIKVVKQFIVYGLGLLLPAMAVTGISGNKLSGKSKATPIQLKKKRMKRIMVVGIVVLIPAAFVLNYLAQSNSFWILFYSIQGIELIAGGTNISLMGMNMKEGFTLSGRVRRVRKTRH